MSRRSVARRGRRAQPPGQLVEARVAGRVVVGQQELAAGLRVGAGGGRLPARLRRLLPPTGRAGTPSVMRTPSVMIANFLLQTGLNMPIPAEEANPSPAPLAPMPVSVSVSASVSV